MQDQKADFIKTFQMTSLKLLVNVRLNILKTLTLFFLLQTTAISAFQTMPKPSVEVTLSLSTNQTISVEIESEKADAFWEFLTSYANVTNLEKRIENLKFFDENGLEISYARIGEGKFVVDKPVKHIRYDVKTALAENFAGIAHVSWIDQSQGLLVLADLIPRNFEANSAKVNFRLPAEWKILSNESEITEQSGRSYFAVEKVEKAVFLVCKEFREKSFSAGKTKIKFAFVGEWEFIEEAVKLAERIFAEYTGKIGELSFPKVQIFLIPFPEKTRFNHWQAETKGATVTIVSAPPAFKSNALNLLSEQLRHEILHLWIPNSLSLKGNYDWFFEGFVIYQSLKSGVLMGEIRFDNFLSHIASAFDSIQTSLQEVSLLELSNNRWQLPIAERKILYARSLLTAFLLDIKLLRNRKHGIEIIFRELLRKFTGKSEDANKAILAVLRRYDADFVSRYIENMAQINLPSQLADFGIQVKKVSGRTKLEVAENLSSRQKDLLEKLGYNQWRRISVKIKQ
ncbi:MAG: hypothetical protein KatS3mg006_1147 [Pyrinomonadaceae bacterium]|nr:MAG: hypothetical protein KatS3mg006_1147 [Pyrinomonadaceae bacterium]